MDIGKNIALRRKELKMTQEELAYKMGYKNKTSITKIEQGKNDIPQSKIEEFAKALGTTVLDLMGWYEGDISEKIEKPTGEDSGELSAEEIELIKLWPDLPVDVRQAVLTLARSVVKEQENRK